MRDSDQESRQATQQVQGNNAVHPIEAFTDRPIRAYLLTYPAQTIPPPRCTCIRVFVQASPRTHMRHFILLPPITREAERRTAHRARCQTRPEETAPVTRYSRGLHYKGRSPFGAPLRIDRTFVLPRPGQRLLESPDANGSSALPLRHQCSEHLAVRTRAGRA